MKVFILADINSPHTQKWVRGLIGQGIEVFVFSLGNASENFFLGLANQPVLYSASIAVSGRSSVKTKMTYLKALPLVKRIIRTHKPDILHAFYATSYGLLGALTGFQPFCISVWGSDVFSFPSKSIFFAKGLELIFSRAMIVWSTSKAMEVQTRKFFKGPIEVIPFGISFADFSTVHTKKGKMMRFAVVKSLSEIYNIHLVISAFAELAEANEQLAAELHIAGDGHLRKKLERLAGKWKDSKIFFHGNIPNLKIPKFLENKDILFNVSEFESFGVSVIEASAMGLAVVTSNRGGLVEVVQDQVTGVMLTHLTQQSVLEAMVFFLKNPHLAEIMGKAGREFVLENFDFNKNLDQQISAYKQILKNEH